MMPLVSRRHVLRSALAAIALPRLVTAADEATEDWPDLDEPNFEAKIIATSEIPAEFRKSFKLGQRKGLLVLRVAEGSFLTLAGIRAGAWLATCNGKPLRTRDDLSEITKGCQLGDEFEFTGCNPVLQGGQYLYKGTEKVKVKVLSLGECSRRLMVFEEDDVESKKWMRHDKASTVIASHQPLRLYFEMKGESASNLRCLITLRVKDWLFARSVSIKSGDALVAVNPQRTEWKREVLDGNDLVEWLDLSVDKELLEALRPAISRKATMIRFKGENSVTDVDVDEAILDRLYYTFNAFRSYGGSVPT